MNTAWCNGLAGVLAVLLFSCGDGAGPEAPPGPSEPQRTEARRAPARPPPATEPDAAGASRAAAGIPGVVVTATELKGKPFADAPTIAGLKPKTELQILARQGGWYHVRASAGEGWVRLLGVRREPQTATGEVGVDDVADLATGRAGSGNVAATSGIRGLTAGQLRMAAPDPEALQRMEGYGVGRQEAAAQARKRGLSARNLDYLPEPG